MDMQMPIMDGYTVTAKPVNADMLDHALTAHAMSGDRDSALMVMTIIRPSPHVSTLGLVHR